MRRQKMIKLEKLEEPDLLKENKDQWLREYLEAHQQNQWTDTIRYRYREEAIKTRIKEETYKKCVYCESKIMQCSHGDVEHILPKSRFPELVLTWSNLTLGCSICNTKKGAYYSEQIPLVNPYQNNPGDFLIATGSLVFQQLGNQIGEITVRKLDLNRPDLLERRVERLKSLLNLITRYIEANTQELKDSLLDQLKEEVRSDKEYTFVSKKFLKIDCAIPLED